MSLLMLKTKNLSWQDHTLNIEVMLAPLRSTLLLNKHKTLDTKFDKEKVLYEKQKEACIKDFVLEKRLIERRRQKILKRKKDLLAETRARSAMEQKEDEEEEEIKKQERTSSAPTATRGERQEQPSLLPKLPLKHTPLFGANFLRPRVFLETASSSDQRQPGSTSSVTSGVDDKPKSASSKPPTGRKTPGKDLVSSGKIPEPPPENLRGLPRRNPGVTFLDFLDEFNDSEDEGNITVEVKPKTVEEKVRDFLREMDSFNSRPPTACSSHGDRTDDSVITGRLSRNSERRVYNMSTLAQDKRLLERAFDRYVEKQSHEDLLKAMKLAAKMKSHIRQAKQANAALVPTMSNFKSSRSFMRLLKRQQRKDKQPPLKV